MFFILVSYAAMAALPDISRHVPEMTGLTGFIMILIAAYVTICEKGGITGSPKVIITAAIVFRLMFLFAAPHLSDDIYRYLFDGRMLLGGHNPYALSPEAAALRFGQMAGLAGKVNHPGLVTLYPPAAQLVFAAGALTRGVIGMKCALALMDIAACLLIVRLLSMLKRPVVRAVWYAWHPLAVLEIAGSGHIDVAGICFFFLALFLMFSNAPGHRHPTVDPAAPSVKRLASAGAAFAAATLVKLYPLVFLPGMLMLTRGIKRAWFIFAFLITGLCLAGPFLPDLSNGVHTLDIYLRNWEFAGYAFRTLRSLLHNGLVAREILTLLFALAAAGIYGHALRADKSDIRPRPDRILTAFYGICLAWLMLTPTLHPWYALYLAALLPFCAGPAGVCLTWSVLLGYRVLIPFKLTGQWIESDRTALMIVSAPLLAVLLSFVVRLISRRRASPDNPAPGTS